MVIAILSFRPPWLRPSGYPVTVVHHARRGWDLPGWNSVCPRLATARLIKCQIEPEDIHPRVAKHADEAILGRFGNQISHLHFGHPAGFGNARYLELRRSGGYVGIETAPRGGHKVDRNRRPVLRLQPFCIASNPFDERLAGRSE